MLRSLTIAFILLIVIGVHNAVDAGLALIEVSNTGFIPNHGQIRGESDNDAAHVILSTHSNGQQLFLTTKGFTYLFSRNEKLDDGSLVQHRYRLDVQLYGADIRPDRIDWLEPIPDQTYNYYYPHCPDGILNVLAYKALRIRDVYPGIDWYIEKNADGLKYNFELKPGADPGHIRLDYNGAEQLGFDYDGSIVVTTPLGKIIEAAPVSFQDGKEIPTAYRLSGNTVTFDVAPYNTSKALELDPTLIWGSVYGGFLKDEFRSITYDANGNLYATGYTASPDFPVMSAGTFFTDTLTGTVNAPRSDVVIVKFNPNNGLVWATYYGGSNTDGLECGYAALTDAAGNLFVAGITSSSNFPTQDAGTYFDGTFGGSTDGFLLKFNPAGQRLMATYFGGVGDDYIYDLCLDAASNVYACGNTTSQNFPLQANGAAYFQTSAALMNGFVVKFSNSGNLDWSTLLIGDQTDEARSIASDGANIFVSGFTNSTNFPLQNAGTYYQSQLNGSGSSGFDMFLSKFNSAGALSWSTYYGGAANDYGMSIAMAPAGELFVLGATNSTDFPVQNYNATSYFDSQLNNGDSIHFDACILNFANDGTRLWATYLGGSEDEVRPFYQFMPYMNDQLRTDACGNVYGGIVSRSSDFPLQNAMCNSYFNPTRGGTQDPVLFKFTRQLKLQWSTYYGGSSDNENGLCVALNAKSRVAVSGVTGPSVGTPILFLPSAYNSNSIDSIDAFIGVFTQPSFLPAISTSLCSGPCTGTLDIAVNTSCNVPGYTYQWSNGLSGNTASGLCAGTYTITVTDTLNCVSETAVATVASGISIQPVVDAVSCNFACTGYASVNLPNASGLTYQWSNGTTGQYAAALCPGNYSVTVTAPGCGSASAPFSIVLPPPLVIQVSSLEPTCGANCNATASVVITGGQTLPYITWSNGDVGPVGTNLCPNQSYIITASDSLCYTATYTLNVPMASMTGSITGVNGCGCNNSLTVNVNNATNYQILWSTNDTTATVTGLCPGNYTVTITDAFCGTLVLNKTVISPTPYVHNVTCYYVGCPDSCNVWCTVIVGPSIPGTSPTQYYQYPQPVSTQWFDSAGNPVSYPMCVGNTYNYLWQNGCGDTLTGVKYVFPNYFIMASLTVLDYTCPGTCEGVMKIGQLLGGTPPYTFAWSNGFFGTTSYNLCAGGSYSLTITDACGYQVVKPFVFPQASQVAVNTGYSPSCAPICNGTAYGFTTGGIGPYNYNWNTGASTSQIIQTCPNTWYYVTVTDACDSIDVDSVMVVLAAPQTNSVVHSPSVCPLQCNGTATVLSYGGTPPFVYSWNTGGAGSQATNLCPGVTYTVVILDPGCSLDTVSFVIPPNQIDVVLNNLVDNDCYYNCNGSVDVSVTGGSPPFAYSWSNGALTQDISGVCQGAYVLVAYDPGCSVDSFGVYIDGPGPTQATASVDTLICHYDCLATGLVQITGGLPPFNISWSNGDTDSIAGGLCQGAHFVVVEDPGCWSDTLFINVTFLSEIQAQIGLVSDIPCFDSCNGVAALYVFDGIGPYQFTWSSGETSDTAFNLCVGVASVTVTDSLGCQATGNTPIAQPTPLQTFFTISPSHCWNPDGHISVEVTGGTPGYSYVWSTGSSDSNVSGLDPGTYYLTVYDAHDCPRYDSASFLGLYSELYVSDDITIYIGQQTPLLVSGANSYTWFPSFGLSCYDCDTPMVFILNTTMFCVIGEDIYGCPDTACVTIKINTDCGDVRFPNAFTPNGDGLNDVFRPVGLCIRTSNMVVVNRWGQVVYESSDYLSGWNGTYNGKDAEVGTYGFYATVTNWLNQQFEIRGNVTLLR